MADVGHLCQHTAWLIRCAAVMTKLVVPRIKGTKVLQTLLVPGPQLFPPPDSLWSAGRRGLCRWEVVVGGVVIHLLTYPDVS
jgi:hypothetical protein